MSIITFMRPKPKRQYAKEKIVRFQVTVFVFPCSEYSFFSPIRKKKREKTRAWSLFWSGSKCRTPTPAPHGPSPGPQQRKKRPIPVASDGGNRGDEGMGGVGEGGGHKSFFHTSTGFPWLSLVRPPTPKTGSLNKYTCSAFYIGPCAQRYIKEQSVKSLHLY